MSKKFSLIILICILVLSAILTGVFFRPQDTLSNTPIYNDDYAMHFFQCLTVKHFLSQFGKCWAYDPFFLAGFPNGALVNADNKAWELFYFAYSPFIGKWFAFKAYVLLLLLTYPFLVYWTAKNFSLPPGQSLIASFLAILLCFLSLARIFIYCGMVSYVFAVFLSLYALSLFYKLCKNTITWKHYLLVVLVFSLTIMTHILSFMHIVIPMLVLYGINLRKISFRQHIMILMLPVFMLGLNSYWLMPVAEFFSIRTTNPRDWEFTFQIRNVLEPLKVYIQQKKTVEYTYAELNNTFIDAFLALFGTLGLYFWYKAKRNDVLIAFIAGILFICIVAFYGSHTNFVATMQPERFTVALSLLFLVPSSIGFYEAIQNTVRGKSTGAIIFILCAAFVLLYRPVMEPFRLFFNNRWYHVNCEFPQQITDLLGFLEKSTSREGRILLEDSEYIKYKSPNHEYFGGHLPALFSEYVKREYLCGPRPMYPIKHSYASFTRGVLFEKNIDEYTLTQLKEVFDVYNVRWIVCWFQGSKKIFEQFPEYIVKLSDIDKFSVYEVNRRPSFFIKGKGTVHADYNRLELKNIIAEDNEIIISYHWMEKLKALPGGMIGKALLAGDPVGFIHIKNPPSSLTIVNSY